jgi:Phosphoesterase family
VSSFIEEAERGALRAAAHLLPKEWQQLIDIVTAPVPPTPATRIPAPDDEAARRLDRVEHIVVVMLENRSFDHMLGYLSLPEALGERARTNLDGLRGAERDVNSADGAPHAIHHLERTQFSGEAEDPDHSGHSVDEQVAGGALSGFAQNFARISRARAAKARRQRSGSGSRDGLLRRRGPTGLRPPRGRILRCRSLVQLRSRGHVAEPPVCRRGSLGRDSRRCRTPAL